MNRKNNTYLIVYSIIVIAISVFIGSFKVNQSVIATVSSSPEFTDGRILKSHPLTIGQTITAITKTNQNSILYGGYNSLYFQKDSNIWKLEPVDLGNGNFGYAKEFVVNQNSSDPNTYLKYSNQIFRYRQGILYSLDLPLDSVLVPFSSDKLIAISNNLIYYQDYLANLSVQNTLPATQIISAFNYQNQVYLIAKDTSLSKVFLYQVSIINSQLYFTKKGQITFSGSIQPTSFTKIKVISKNNRLYFLGVYNQKLYYSDSFNLGGLSTINSYYLPISQYLVENRQNYLNLIFQSNNQLKQAYFSGIGSTLIYSQDFDQNSLPALSFTAFASLDSSRLLIAYPDHLAVLEYPNSADNLSGFNQSIRFDHRGSVVVPFTTKDPSPQYTIEAYFKIFDQSRRNQVIISKQYYYEKNSFVANIDRYTGKVLFRTYNGTSLSPHLYSLKPIEPNKWYHLAITIDNNLIRMFLNGVYQGSVRMNNPIIFDASKPLYIGDYQNESVFGLVDEVRISDIVRYDESSRFPNQPFTNDEHTLLLMHFDNNLDDSSSFQNKGVLKDIGEFLDIIRHDPS